MRPNVRSAPQASIRPERMDVLITGAGGRIGAQLAKMLVSEGHRVRAFGLPGDPGLARLADEAAVDVFEGDLLDRDSLRPAVEDVEVICHLAAALTTHDVADDRFVSTNLVGTFNVLSAARAESAVIERFVYTSSDAVYWPSMGKLPHYLPIDEAHPLIAGSVYGATKIGAEAMCRAFSESHGIPFVVMRPTATASPLELIDPSSPFGRRWFLSSAKQWLETHPRSSSEDWLLDELCEVHDGIERLLLLTDPDGVASLTMITDARDVAGGMRAMLDVPEALGEAFNIGPEAPHSDRELVEALSRGLGLEIVEIPYEAVRPSWYVSSAKARGVLGYRPRFTVFDMVTEALNGQGA